jgi:hypothetical protein
MLRTILIGVWLVAVPAIALAETRVDLDRQKDFSRYKTFTLELTPPIRADGVVDEHNTLAEDRLRKAVARGLEGTDVGADLTVRVSSRETERTVVRSSAWDPYPWSYGWGFHPRWGYWRPSGYWGSYGYGGDVWTRRYIEGSVLIDVIERTPASSFTVPKWRTRSDRDKYVTKAVDPAFKKFPVKEISSN